MAITLNSVTHAPAGGTSSPQTLTPSGLTSVGNLMILVIFSDASTLTGLTDNKGQTYTIIPTSAAGNSGGEFVWIAYKTSSVTGVTSFTATFTTTGGVQAEVYDCSSTTGGAFDAVAAFNNQSGANPNPSITASAAGIAVCGLGSASVTPSAVSSPFTLDLTDFSMGSVFSASHDVNASPGSLTSTFTATTSAWAGLIATFIEAGVTQPTAYFTLDDSGVSFAPISSKPTITNIW